MRKLTTEEFIEKVKEKVGNEFSVLGDYINTKTPILMRHNSKLCNYYEFKTTPNHFLSRCGCDKCNRIKFTNKAKEKNQKAKETFLQRVKDQVGDEYTFLEDYIDTHTKILVRHNSELCDNHVYKVTPTEFLDGGNRCPKCKGLNNKKSKILDFKNVIKEIKELSNDTYTVLDDKYTGNKDNIKMQCPNGHIIKISLVNFRAGHRCVYCMNKESGSKAEKEVVEYINKILEKENNMKVIENDKTILNGKELDIYIPEKSIAIEYDGLYWHSYEVLLERNITIPDIKNYHLHKTELCKEKGIRLIHIFDDEWNFKNKLVKKKLAYILGKANNLPKIYARKCFVKEINNSKIKNKFLDKYHIQGSDKSNINLGLYYRRPKDNKTILVSVMTFCKPRKSLGQNSKTTSYDYELSRFASTYNYLVVGAFGKLFSYFKRNYEWNNLITYADKRWSEGNVYLKNNWIYDHDSKPNYWYTDNEVRYHRFQFNKKSLEKYANNSSSRYYDTFKDIFSKNKTEREIMLEAGFKRIYDCGNMVFRYEKNN